MSEPPKGKNATTNLGTGEKKRKVVKAVRLAKALVALRDEVNQWHPKRNKESDGWIGDPAHAARKSDHNPNSAKVVCALDITHDPGMGVDARALADTLRASADARLNYVISNGEIASAGGPWRPYSGSNAHRKHCHVSVKQDASLYDDGRSWGIVLSNRLDDKHLPGGPPNTALA